MFADDTNLFYSNRNTNKLFENVNKKLAKVIYVSRIKCQLIQAKQNIYYFRNKRIGITYP